MKSKYIENTLMLDTDLCTGCGMCHVVCPHRVFQINDRKAQIVKPASCMECGACARNCPTEALNVKAGVGCAAAVIKGALGRESSSCCCSAEQCETPETSSNT